MSQEPCCCKAAIACWLLPISSPAMRCVSSAVRAVSPAIFTGTNWPLSSTWGKLAGEKIRSLTRLPACSIANSSAGVGITCLGGAGAVTTAAAAAELAPGNVGGFDKGLAPFSMKLTFALEVASSDERSRQITIHLVTTPQMVLLCPACARPGNHRPQHQPQVDWPPGVASNDWPWIDWPRTDW